MAPEVRRCHILQELKGPLFLLSRKLIVLVTDEKVQWINLTVFRF